MFERYTERARRVIFFGRYEASQFGDPEISDAHLLLGLLREDKALFYRLLSHREPETSRASEDATVNDLRKKVEEQIGPPRPAISTSVDLPLSSASRRILAYAAEEAEKLNHHHIDSQHLLLGVLREQDCLAALILANEGITLAAAREMIAGSAAVEVPPTTAAGVGGGQGAGFPRTRALVNVSILEFHCEGKIIASAVVPAASPIPRAGERVTIRARKVRSFRTASRT